MSELTASRTLVKSAPELWAQCSDPRSLAWHLQAFGEITITRLDPETTVAWEGERIRGTVRIEPSGWGTRVTLTADPSAEPAPSEPAVASAAVSPVASAGGSPVASAGVSPVASAGVSPVALQAVPEAPVERPSTEVRRRGLLAWLTVRRTPPVAEPAVAQDDAGPKPVAHDDVAPEMVAHDDVAPKPVAAEDVAPDAGASIVAERPRLDPPAALDAALQSLGQAHRRPFSRT